MSMKSVKRRSKLEVNRDILLEVKKSGNNISPTNLMRKSNLSFGMFEEYIFELEKKNFLVRNEVSKKSSRFVYSLTDIGVNFLNRFDEFREFLDEFGF